MARDLIPTALADLDWKTGSRKAALAALIEYSDGKARDAVKWYYDRRKWRQFFCRGFRLTAILLVAFAGLLPLWNEISGPPSDSASPSSVPADISAPSVMPTKANTGSVVAKAESEGRDSNRATGPIRSSLPRLHPLWAGIALAVAGTIILIDRFYGFTTSWVRFILAAQELTALRDSFRFEIEKQKATWGEREPTPEQLVSAIALTSGFVAATHRVIADETNRWTAEFAEVLTEIDQQLKVSTQTKELSALRLLVTNGGECSDGWTVVIDEQVAGRKTGREAAFNLVAGVHLIRVEGIAGGKTVVSESPVKVAPGDVALVTLTLS